MVLSHGQWPYLYLKRLTLWITGALDASWISTGPNWSPMTRSVLVLGSHSCQTLSADVVSFSMVTSTAPTLGRIIIAPSKLASWSLLTDLTENSGDRPASNELWPGVSQTMCTGQSGMATTRAMGKKWTADLLICGYCLLKHSLFVV